MSVANVMMFEFESSQAVEDFAAWYKGHGAYPDNQVSLFVRTGNTSAIGISVYPSEEARNRADDIRNENASTALGSLVREIVPLSGEVLVHFLRGKLLE